MECVRLVGVVRVRLPAEIPSPPDPRGCTVTRALAALAARVVGRRVRLRDGPRVATVTRVTGRGLTVTIRDVRAEDIAEWMD